VIEVNKTFLTLARGILTVVLVNGVGISALYAIDSNNRVRLRRWPEAARTTSSSERKGWIRWNSSIRAIRRSYEIVDKVVEHWIAGFLTAHNLYERHL
jgi:hypothetical protein